MKKTDLYGNPVERSLADMLKEELAKGDTAQELCSQLIERAKQGDNAAFKMISSILGNRGIKL